MFASFSVYLCNNDNAQAHWMLYWHYNMRKEVNSVDNLSCLNCYGLNPNWKQNFPCQRKIHCDGAMSIFCFFFAFIHCSNANHHRQCSENIFDGNLNHTAIYHRTKFDDFLRENSLLVWIKYVKNVWEQNKNSFQQNHAQLCLLISLW